MGGNPMAEHITEVSNRVRANRANALKSTGPRTAEGKRKSSLNAVRHGLCSANEVIAFCDTASEFEPFQASMHEHFYPIGPYETALVERIVACSWRLRRVIHLEAILMSVDLGDGKFADVAFTTDGTGTDFLSLSRYETAIERSLYRAMQELRTTQAGRKADNLVLALPTPTEDR
jgi:hypothetical protein